MKKPKRKLTGWATMQRARLGRFSVNNDGTKQDVELARIVASSANLLSSAKTCFFKSRFSGVHS